jgi:hypothetical protein
MAGFKKYMNWKNLKRALPIFAGAGLGYSYYYFIGCVSGTCPITSNPWISTTYGALLGFLIVPRKKKAKE